jgi:hypothetical protein
VNHILEHTRDIGYFYHTGVDFYNVPAKLSHLHPFWTPWMIICNFRVQSEIWMRCENPIGCYMFQVRKWKLRSKFPRSWPHTHNYQRVITTTLVCRRIKPQKSHEELTVRTNVLSMGRHNVLCQSNHSNQWKRKSSLLNYSNILMLLP